MTIVDTKRNRFCMLFHKNNKYNSGVAPEPCSVGFAVGNHISIYLRICANASQLCPSFGSPCHRGRFIIYGIPINANENS